MSKKLFCLMLAVLMAFTFALPAFAADEETDAAVTEEKKAPRPDGLPDIDVNSWEYILANSYNSISLYDAKVSYCYGLGIDSRILDQTIAFFEAARNEGYPAYLNCANFSWLYYMCTHTESLIKLKYGDAYHASLNELGPGCSDHQTGLGFDLAVNPMYQGYFDAKDPDAKGSDTYKWMVEHCAEYGFIERYPEGKSDYYGVACDGAHFRYVGEEAARYIMDNNLCLEEFLMLYDYPVHMGTAVKDGAAEKDNYVPAY